MEKDHPLLEAVQKDEWMRSLSLGCIFFEEKAISLVGCTFGLSVEVKRCDPSGSFQR